MSDRTLRLTVVVALALTAALGPAPLAVGLGASAAYAADDSCAPAGSNAPADPWATALLAPDQAWPLTTGRGQRVAVLDSGVDATAPQLRGRVEDGFDAIRNSGRANTDCLGLGTRVAGTIGASRTSAGVYGLAPGATIVPVRVVGEPGPNMSTTPAAAVLARGIRWAAGHDVDVIDVSVWLTKDDPDVRAAVADAVADGVTVVAAAGDLGSGDDGNPITYPAAYPNVIAVTAIGPGGAPWDSAEHGGFVDLAAPGAGVAVLARGHGVVTPEGSSAIAAGFVSATAALVQARFPRLDATGVARRLFASATPASAGVYGHGIVNPVQAATTGLSDQPPVTAAPIRPVTLSAAQVAAAREARLSRDRAIEWTVIGLGTLLVVAILAIGMPRARRRAWRPSYAPEPESIREPIEPEPVALLFEDPA